MLTHTKNLTMFRIALASLLLVLSPRFGHAWQAQAGYGPGVASCNCSTTDTITGANIPHSANVKVTVANQDEEGTSSDAGSWPTGLSGPAYTGQTLAPGK